MNERTVTEQEMIAYLQKMKQLEEQNTLRRKEIYKNIETLEECIERNTFVHSENVGSSGSTQKDTAYRILMSAYRDFEQQLELYNRILYEILQEDEKIDLIWKCIRYLPRIHSSIIVALYIEGQQWEIYARENYMSRATVFRTKKAAIQNLVVLYNAQVK